MNWTAVGAIILCVVGGIEIGRSLEYQEPEEPPELLFGLGWIFFGIGEFAMKSGWVVLLLTILGVIGVVWGAIRKKNMAQTVRGRRLDLMVTWLVLLALAIPVLGKHFGAVR